MVTGKKKGKVVAMTFNLTHTRHDPAHCLAPGLFRSLKKGERKTGKLDVTFVYGDESIKFWGPEPLGADDLRVLQGLVAMAATSAENGRGIMLHPEPRTEEGKQVRIRLDLKWDAIEKDGMVAKGSYRQLARELGYEDADGGKRFRLIRGSIERLWAVSVIVDKGGKRQGFRILSDYESDAKDGKLFIALNPRLASAIVGDQRHTRIEMSEVRALNSDPARLIHQRLCGWIDQGKSGKIKIDNLAAYVWPDVIEIPAATLRQRRATVKKALLELVALGWKAQEGAGGVWSIERPAI